MSIRRRCPGSEGKSRFGDIWQEAQAGCAGRVFKGWGCRQTKGASRQLPAESGSPWPRRWESWHDGLRNNCTVPQDQVLGQRRSPASAAVKPKRSAELCSREGFLADGRHHLSRPRTSDCSCRLPDAASPLLQVVCSGCLGPSRPLLTQDGAQRPPLCLIIPTPFISQAPYR